MNTMNNTTNQHSSYVGIDIGKSELVCCYLYSQASEKKESLTVANTPSGHKKIISWIQTLQQKNQTSITTVMEATSSYWETIAAHLNTANQPVCVVQPLRIAHFAKVLFKRSKSDSADAHTIALYGHSQHPVKWQPLTQTHQQSKAISRRIKQLQKMLQAEKNHLEHTNDSYCQKDIKATIKQLTTRIEKLKQQLQSIVQEDPLLDSQFKLLQSINGIGAQSASQLIAELPNLAEFEDARQLAAWAGLTPRHHQSGTSGKTKTPISKIGSNHLREILYFPALVGTRYNPILKTFRDRLIENGKTKLQAVIAAMRKLLHIIYGVLTTQQPFDPNHQNKTQAKQTQCPAAT
jgi:transposase